MQNDDKVRNDYGQSVRAALANERFQARVLPWMHVTFGPAISVNRKERNHRFYEEATELVQAAGMTAQEAHQLVDYTFGRPVGELPQEVGGTMVTLAALCLAQGINMHDEADTELARVWGLVEQIRAKQASKPKFGPLPEAPKAPQIDLFDFVMHMLDAEINAPGPAAGFAADVRRALRAAGFTSKLNQATVFSIPADELHVEEVDLLKPRTVSGKLFVGGTPLGNVTLHHGGFAMPYVSNVMKQAELQKQERANTEAAAKLRAVTETPRVTHPRTGLRHVVKRLQDVVEHDKRRVSNISRHDVSLAKTMLEELTALSVLTLHNGELKIAEDLRAEAHHKMGVYLSSVAEREDSHNDTVKACDAIMRFSTETWRSDLREYMYRPEVTKVSDLCWFVFNKLTAEGYNI